MDRSVLEDPERLAALARSGLVDSGPEEVFDRLTRLASKLLGVPIALMTLLDSERQHVKSAVGEIGPPVPVSQSFCQHVIAGAAPLTVEDVRTDERLGDTTALQDAQLITYCGVPLTGSDGHTIGSLCAMDATPRAWSPEDVETLRDLAAAAMTEIELRLACRQLAAREREVSSIQQTAHEAFLGLAPDATIVAWNPAATRLLGFTPEEAIGCSALELFVPERLHATARDGLLGADAQLDGRRVEFQVNHRDGHELEVEVSTSLVELPEGRRINILMWDVGQVRTLQRRHAYLAGVVEAAEDAIGTADLAGRVTSWNRASERLFGYTAAELIGRPFPAIAGPESESGPALAARALAGEAVTTHGAARRRKDGTIVYVDVSVSPLRDADEAIVGITAIARDVTERHRLELELAASEARFRRTFDDAPIGIALVDLQRRVQTANRAYCEMLGYAEHELVGRTLHDFTHPDDVDNDRAGARAMIAGETAAYRVDKRYLHRSGRIVRAQLSASLVRGQGGAPSHFIAHAEDITDRRAREDENRMLATVVQQSEDAIEAKDLQGTITEWSGAAQRMYGYTREEAVGRPVKELIVPEELYGEEDEGMRRVRVGEAMQIDTVRRHKNGTLVDVSISISPICNEQGAVVGVSVIGRDISERIREQQARREAEERLRVTVEHAPIGVALIDLEAGPHGRLLSVNDAFATLLSDPDPVGSEISLTSVVHPDNAESLRAALGLLASDELARVETEVRCLHPDGTIVWLLLTGAAVPSGEGLPRLAVIHALDIGDRKRFEGQLQHLADHDPLTGLFNRRRFEQELDRAVSLTDRYAHSGALLMIDLDGFKQVNDSMGHSYGDELISRVGSTLRACLRDTDVIARLGGDEFAIILPAVDSEQAAVVAEKLLGEIERRGVVVSDHRHAGVTGSIGVAPFVAHSGLDAEALLVAADLAMYRAKEAGRNQIAFVSADGHAGPLLAPQRSWLARLRTALDHDGLELFAQPIRAICAPAGERYELLLRMRGEDEELITPGTFLYNAERFDLIQEIDRWVFSRALALLARHHDSDLSLSVNMSGKTLSDPTLVDDLSAMVTACPVPPGRLVVEVTETAAIVNIDKAGEVARALRALGCRFALDDFGAGFASFYYLKHLEFDYVKIDGEFVKALGQNPADQLVVRSVVDIARGLGAETIAEFVGDEAAVHRLRELGVDYGQGYHLGRPAPVNEVLPCPTAGVRPGQPSAAARSFSAVIESSSSATSRAIRPATSSSESL